MTLDAGARDGPLRDPVSAGRGRHGRGVSRARYRLGRAVARQGAAGRRLRTIPNGSPGSSAKRRHSPRSTIRTSRRFTASSESHGMLCAGDGTGRRADAGRTDRARARCPLDEALPIARQIAEALEAAHEQGDHPSRSEAGQHQGASPTATVKVLDFGLAKADGVRPAAVSAAASRNSPTITTPAHDRQQACILGTAAYMSPEQATGKPIDKRTDIWAFGCVVYEMLTGRRAFEGDTVSRDARASLGAGTRLEPGARDASCDDGDVPASLPAARQQGPNPRHRRRSARTVRRL